MFWWNGKSSDDFGLYVEHYPNFKFPERRTNFYTVGGRIGDVVQQLPELNNYTQAYDVYISAETRKLPNAISRICEWLYSAEGYAILEDSYSVGTYRKACFVGGQDIENSFNKFGRATIEFNCKPQRFLRSGDEWIDLLPHHGYNKRHTLRGGSDVFPAKPLLEIEGTGYLYIYLFCDNGKSEGVEFNSVTGVYSYDFETLEHDTLFDWDIEKDFIQTNGIPRFSLYNGEIYWSNDRVWGEPTEEDVITKLRMKPRWWTL